MKRTWIVIFLLVMGFAPVRASSDSRVSPELRLSCDPASFSPNGDHVKDQTFIQPSLNVSDQVKKWEMTIQPSHSREIVKKTSGSDGLPALLVWGGEDQKGRPVREGTYVIKLSVWMEKFGKLSASAEVVLDVTPPIVEVNVYTPSLTPGSTGAQGSLTFHTSYQGASGVDRWELSVGQEGGAAVRVWHSTGTIPDVITWDGKDEHLGVSVPAGHYQARLTAWDLAGNAGEAQPAIFQVNEAPPSSVAVMPPVVAFASSSATPSPTAVTPSPVVTVPSPAAVLKHLSMKESLTGKVAWMSASDLFVEDGLDPPLKPTAWDSLNELTQLIQAYPDWTCLIEGYSHHRSAPAQDKDLSSSWAWRVYGALVKSGVSAKRLEVRGRGREAGVSSSDKSFNGIVVTLTKSQQGTP